MARISEDTIERVRAANDIVDLIGSYLQLKRAGTSWKGLCPFHNEKTPSFHVNPGRQNFHCFGCGAGGSVFGFVMDYEGIDYVAAVRKLAQRAGIIIEDETEEDRERRGERDRMLGLHKAVAEWFHANLMRRRIGEAAREYLAGRGIGSEVATRWTLGFAPDSWDGLAGWALDQGYREGELARAGLVAQRDGGGVYDRFRNRVIFPIHSDYGEVIAFSGRTLGDDSAKYVNSPETPIFTKGRVLFGLHQTKRAILSADEAVVCEGQVDLIAAFEAGVTNAIAPQGTAFTDQQARLVRQFAKAVVLCFDSDAAGQKAVERSLPSLLGKGVAVRVARMPVGEDPDSLIQKEGVGAFRKRIAGARDYFEEALELGLTADGSPGGRAELAGRLAIFLKSIPDAGLREALGNRIRTRLEISPAAFESILRAARSERVEARGEEATSVEVLRLPEGIRMLCGYAIVSVEAREWLRGQPRLSETFGEHYEFVDRVVDCEEALENPGVLAAFGSRLDRAEERFLVTLELERLKADPVRAVQDAWHGLMMSMLPEKIARLQARAKEPGRSIQEIDGILKEVLDLQKALSQVVRPF
ncbi:MAG: DNA primase [Chthoniobacterales bacterium]